MNVTERTESDVTIYNLEGRIDSEGAVDLDLLLQAAIADGKYKLVLDMSKVTFLNSSGLRTLADILTQARRSDGDLFLVSLSKRVKRVFQIIGFDKFFLVFDDVESAVKAF